MSGLALQKELGGTGDGTNPEQLFAAGYAACFATSMQLVAQKKKIDVSGMSVTAEVGLVPNGQGGFQLEVTPADDAAAEPAPECRSRAHRGHPLGLPVFQRHARQHADRAAAGEPGWGSEICFC
jgi:Ohr subfamily peroxiredoxin